MENVILIIHLLLALSLIGVVLLQRSEGGGLGMGGGGGAMSQRSAATAMGKLTWILAIAFIVTSISLTIISARNASGSSILDRIGNTSAPAAETTDAPAPLETDGLLPPPTGADADAPLVPRAD
ncbi:preprotein translocase subunit SecG [Primorskyibacter sp. 2E233]|uniref:preprotein translocase subunit SecG n=1 Tax=Primorskyibacter sp. 2E233 TaxID=3413431 RepID=UPI003BF2245C